MKAVDRRGSRAADCVSVPSITGLLMKAYLYAGMPVEAVVVSVPSITGLLMKACERDRRSLGFGCFSPLYNGALNEGRTSSSRGRTHRQGFSPLYNGALNEGARMSRGLARSACRGFSPLYNGALNEVS